MHPEERSLLLARRASRRDLLRSALGASALLLVEACGPSPSSGGPVPTTSAPAPVGGGAAPTARPAAQPAPTAPAVAPTSAPAGTAAPAGSKTFQAVRGGTLRVGLDVDADTLDPRLTKNTSGFRIRELTFNGLVGINPDFTPVPDLAEKWDNPDDKTWVFHLR